MPGLGSWDAVAEFALALPGTEAGPYFGVPAIKVAANGRTFLSIGNHTDSFVLMIDQDSKQMLLDTDPATFWQTAHYERWPALLVRYASNDPERVAMLIERARDQAAAKKPARPRARR